MPNLRASETESAASNGEAVVAMTAFRHRILRITSRCQRGQFFVGRYQRCARKIRCKCFAYQWIVWVIAWARNLSDTTKSSRSSRAMWTGITQAIFIVFGNLICIDCARYLLGRGLQYSKSHNPEPAGQGKLESGRSTRRLLWQNRIYQAYLVRDVETPDPKCRERAETKKSMIKHDKVEEQDFSYRPLSYSPIVVPLSSREERDWTAAASNDPTELRYEEYLESLTRNLNSTRSCASAFPAPHAGRRNDFSSGSATTLLLTYR